MTFFRILAHQGVNNLGVDCYGWCRPQRVWTTEDFTHNHMIAEHMLNGTVLGAHRISLFHRSEPPPTESAVSPSRVRVAVAHDLLSLGG